MSARSVRAYAKTHWTKEDQAALDKLLEKKARLEKAQRMQELRQAIDDLIVKLEPLIDDLPVWRDTLRLLMDVRECTKVEQ